MYKRQVYDPATNRWSELAPLPQGRDHMGLVNLDGKLYAVGGRFNTFEYNTNLLEMCIRDRFSATPKISRCG